MVVDDGRMKEMEKTACERVSEDQFQRGSRECRSGCGQGGDYNASGCVFDPQLDLQRPPAFRCHPHPDPFSTNGRRHYDKGVVLGPTDSFHSLTPVLSIGYVIRSITNGPLNRADHPPALPTERAGL